MKKNYFNNVRNISLKPDYYELKCLLFSVFIFTTVYSNIYEVETIQFEYYCSFFVLKCFNY